jgi:protein involved in polysaccharide export with SLBB domain
MNSYLKSLGRVVGLTCFLGTFLALAGCGSLHSPASAETTNNTPSNLESSDLLRPGDILIINFSGVTDPPAKHEDRIREDGFIMLSLIGLVEAAGKTRAELQKEITSKYVPRYYLRLNVNVNSDARYFYVLGEVRQPRNYMFPGTMTVLKAIAAAGDFTDFAKKTKVQVTRAKGKKPIVVDCIAAQKHPELDLPIYPEDKIFVPRRLW